MLKSKEKNEKGEGELIIPQVGVLRTSPTKSELTSIFFPVLPPLFLIQLFNSPLIVVYRAFHLVVRSSFVFLNNKCYWLK